MMFSNEDKREGNHLLLISTRFDLSYVIFNTPKKRENILINVKKKKYLAVYLIQFDSMMITFVLHVCTTV